MAGLPVVASESPSLVDASAWKKHGELFRHQGEPANAWVQNFTSTAEPLENDRWRVWTSVSGPKGVAKNIGYHEGRDGGEWKRTLAVCTPGEPDKNAALAIGGMPEGWEPVRVANVEAADEAAKKGEMAEMETRLVSMQHVIEDLTSKLVAAQHPPMTLSYPEPPAAMQGSRFPWWTTTFLVALIVAAAVALSVGYWLMTRH